MLKLYASIVAIHKVDTTKNYNRWYNLSSILKEFQPMIRAHTNGNHQSTAKLTDSAEK